MLNVLPKFFIVLFLWLSSAHLSLSQQWLCDVEKIEGLKQNCYKYSLILKKATRYFKSQGVGDKNLSTQHIVFVNKDVAYDSPRSRAVSRTALICSNTFSSIIEQVSAGRTATRQWILSFSLGYPLYFGSSSVIDFAGLN